MDYFNELRNKLNSEKNNIEIIHSDIMETNRNYNFHIFKFPNGDAFCYDKRNGKIVFFEHEVFDAGVNLNGLILADSFDDLLEKWSQVLFIDIYDWYEGVGEHGIDLSKSVYDRILQISENIT